MKENIMLKELQNFIDSKQKNHKFKLKGEEYDEEEYVAFRKCCYENWIQHSIYFMNGFMYLQLWV